jgi:N-ethylmaleimide reductase
VEQYRQAAINARAAGFDGVDVHAAGGYLIPQVLITFIYLVMIKDN